MPADIACPATAIARFAALAWQNEAEAGELVIAGDPFRRPARARDLSFVALDQPLAMDRLASNMSLALHRLLFNAFETDLLFLPDTGTDAAPDWRRFDEFYGPETAACAAAARPHLERLAFAALEDEVELSGSWSPQLTLAYFCDFLAREERAPGCDEGDPVMTALLSARDPQAAARHYLVQMAPDFLSEASAMARLAPGAYGPLQSALFNILIDEYGAAVHAAKHSSLFAATMASCGLDPRPHAYWQFYQPGSLALSNYFHFVAANKRHFFRYLGALFYTEASLVNITGRQSRTLRRIFGERVETRYFDEHRHIDRHHRGMVLARLIEPAIAAYGARAIAGILRGFEEFRLLQAQADRDLESQLAWAGSLARNDPRLEPHIAAWRAGALRSETFHESLDERSTTHIHPDDRLLLLESGTMTFHPSAGVAVKLCAGDCLFIPRGRLHGSVVTSVDCLYHQPILPAEAAAGLTRAPMAEVAA
ncbi:iron-containing redox enzyme family protein [Dongia sp.]|uniref:iron-containing redox enzyme family protein n=1 Tax=Dongia sp. TaxID=1977262 RepID=UPI0035B1D1DE